MKARARRVARALSRRWLLLALLLIGLSVVLATIAVVLEWWRPLALGAVLWAAVISGVVLRTYQVNRRVDRRTHRGGLVETRVVPELEAPAPVAPRTAPDPAEAAGVARLLQAQYIGRLDRAEASLATAVARLEEASALLRAAGRETGSSGPVEPEVASPEPSVSAPRHDG